MAVLACGLLLSMSSIRFYEQDSGPVRPVSSSGFEPSPVRANRLPMTARHTRSDLMPQGQRASRMPDAESRIRAFLQRLSKGGRIDSSEFDQLVVDLNAQPAASLAVIRTLLSLNRTTTLLVPEDQLEREALLSLLFLLDSPRVETLALELILRQPQANEVLLIGRFLQSIAPGKYRDAIQDAAWNAISSPDDPGDAMGALYQLLGDTGDLTTATRLMDVPVEQEAFALFALSLLPDGSGLAFLEQSTRVFEQDVILPYEELAIELIAFRASESPNAGDVLLSLASRGLIPRDAWPGVLALVSGEWTLSLEVPSRGLISSYTFHRPEGSQVVYRVRGDPAATNAEREARQSLLDALLRYAPDGVGKF
jgi:hypothetical protein